MTTTPSELISKQKKLIEVYATLISEDETRERVRIHDDLCFALKVPHCEFHPFEDIDFIPTYKQALKIIYDAIDNFEPSKRLPDYGVEACLHCGCCQIPMKDMDEFNAHILTPEHQRNAIRAMDVKLSNLHSKGYIEDIEKHVASGSKEPVDYNVWLTYYKVKKENEILLELNGIMSNLRKIVKEVC
ncbi:hypothetical protein KAU33_04360 [Candidatus Dependentiae bacterium]|nr:hypothetical protein [Candidatus Dependentiae bacterium]